MGRFNYYAIVNGKDGFKGTKETWEECAPLVKGVEGARYKGFSRLEDAEEWMEKTEAKLASETVNIPKTYRDKPYAPSKRARRKISSIEGLSIKQKLKEMEDEVSDLMDRLAGVLNEIDSVLDMIDDDTDDTEEEKKDNCDLPFT